MLRRELLALIGAAPVLGLATGAQAASGSAKTATLPRGSVNGIYVEKAKRRMLLLTNGKVVREYRINLGFNPVGHKQFIGDGKTPEGTYHITHRNPFSRYHLSLGVSYPSRQDQSFARKHGKNPGGDIFIHGTGRGPGRATTDWTRGCIAVSDAEMDEIFRLVQPGTAITIKA